MPEQTKTTTKRSDTQVSTRTRSPDDIEIHSREPWLLHDHDAGEMAILIAKDIYEIKEALKKLRRARTIEGANKAHDAILDLLEFGRVADDGDGYLRWRSGDFAVQDDDEWKRTWKSTAKARSEISTCCWLNVSRNERDTSGYRGS